MGIRVIVLIVFFCSIGCQQEEIKIYLAGDSTISEKRLDKRPETGWGEKLSDFLNQNVTVKNHAENGRSTRTFIEEGRWQNILDSLNKGDYVFIQFGHNDQPKWKDESYTPPDQYKNNLIYFVKSTRDKEATPILLTPVVRRRFNAEEEFFDTHEEYPDIVREVASSENVTLIDAEIQTRNLLKELGAKKSKELFLILEPGKYENYPNELEDNTHFSDYGAKTIAGLVVEEIKNLNIDLENYLID